MNKKKTRNVVLNLTDGQCEILTKICGESSLPVGDYEVTTDWYEIGEGESNTDYFFSDEDLIEWYNSGGIEEIEKKASEKGYNVEHIQTDTVYVSAEDIELGLYSESVRI